MNSLAPNRQKMAICCKELDSIRDIFSEKEKELSVAMAKVDALTRQLDELKDGNIVNSYNISTASANLNVLNGLVAVSNSSKFNIELEKLKQELLYRTKLNEKISEEMLLKQKQIDQRTIELHSIDQRINELKSRLHRKRSLNEQLNAQMKSHHLLKCDSAGSAASAARTPPTNNQSNSALDNLNSENDGPNCNQSSARPLTLRRSIGAGQPYKFTHLKPLNAVEPLRRPQQQQPKSTSEFNSIGHSSSADNAAYSNHSASQNTPAHHRAQQYKHDEGESTSDKHSAQDELASTNQQVTKPHVNSVNNQMNHHSINSNQKTNHHHNQDSYSPHLSTRTTAAKYAHQTNRHPRPADASAGQAMPSQRLNAISNTAKYLIVDRNQKEHVSSEAGFPSDQEFDRVTQSNHPNSHSMNHYVSQSMCPTSQLISNATASNLNTSNRDLIKSDPIKQQQKPNISPVLSSASSSNCSDYTPSISSSNSDLTYQTTNSSYRFANLQHCDRATYKIDTGHVHKIEHTNLIGGDDVTGDRRDHCTASTTGGQSHNGSTCNLLKCKSNDLNNDQQPNAPHSMPNILIESSYTSSLNETHRSDDSYRFGLLQTTSTTGRPSTTSPPVATANNANDSESDLSSEASTTDKFKSPIIKPPHRLVEKSNELRSFESYPIKDDLKISIDNQDWLRKRRPLVADIDLEKHFDTINNPEPQQQLVFVNGQGDQSSFDQNTNKENYCNGNMNSKHDHLANDHKDLMVKDKSQLDHLDELSTSSSSNHSPNSYTDELDANKIELRSVIRNIMCKNLGSSSDKSSTMSEEDETDEDENSVDCKAKINDIKSGIKSLQATIEHQDSEANKPKEKSILTNKLITNNTLAITNDDHHNGDDSVDDKEDTENNYDSNSEERTDEALSCKDEQAIDEVHTDDQEKGCSNKSSLKKQFGKKNRRVSFDPLALFLDAALEGELELVKKTATQVSNPSASSEGVTALHNAICAGHFDIVRFLVEIGCDINAQDHDGWTPLHCAASCNNLPMVKYLVEHGACIFAVTLSDHETPAQKCEEMEDGFQGCSKYLYGMQEKLGVLNGGSVYAIYDYNAQQPDELSFKCGELLRILSKSDESETSEEWWWSSNTQQQKGYVPRNLLSIYPRVSPKSKETIELEN